MSRDEIAYWAEQARRDREECIRRWSETLVLCRCDECGRTPSLFSRGERLVLGCCPHLYTGLAKDGDPLDEDGLPVFGVDIDLVP